MVSRTSYLIGISPTKFNIYQFYPPKCVPGIPFSFLLFIANKDDFRIGLTLPGAVATLKIVNSTLNKHTITNNQAFGLRDGIFNFSGVIVQTTQNATVFFSLEVENITP